MSSYFHTAKKGAIGPRSNASDKPTAVMQQQKKKKEKKSFPDCSKLSSHRASGSVLLQAASSSLLRRSRRRFIPPSQESAFKLFHKKPSEKKMSVEREPRDEKKATYPGNSEMRISSNRFLSNIVLSRSRSGPDMPAMRDTSFLSSSCEFSTRWRSASHR